MRNPLVYTHTALKNFSCEENNQKRYVILKRRRGPTTQLYYESDLVYNVATKMMWKKNSKVHGNQRGKGRVPIQKPRRDLTMPSWISQILLYPKKLSMCWIKDLNVRLCVAKELHSCPTLCDPMDYCPPGSSVHGILHTRLLEWVAVPSSGGSPQPSNWTHVLYVFCTDRQVLFHQCHG